MLMSILLYDISLEGKTTSPQAVDKTVYDPHRRPVFHTVKNPSSKTEKMPTENEAEPRR
jgi:hypothetical protein